MKYIGMLCLLTVGLTTVRAAPLPVLANPSFEEAGAAPDRASGWERWGQWFNREAEWNPVKSGRCIMAYHHFRIETADGSGIWQDVKNVRAGSRYRFSVWANADWSSAGQNASEVELRLESTVNGRQVTIQSKTYPLRDLAAGAEWCALSVAGTAAANNLRVLIVVYPAREGPRDGAVKFDDAQLVSAGSR